MAGEKTRNFGILGDDSTPIITATKTSAYTAGFGELVPVNTTGGAVTITLPSATVRGQVIVKLASGATAVTVQRAGTDTVDGGTSTTVTTTEWSRRFVSDGAGSWTSTR